VEAAVGPGHRLASVATQQGNRLDQRGCGTKGVMTGAGDTGMGVGCA